MSASPQLSQDKNPKTGMTLSEMKEFIRNHFEEFVNRKNVSIGEVNFAPDFVDHGADVPPGLPPGPAGAMRYVGANFFVHNVSMDEPDPVNRPYDNQHEQIGLNFCESPTGTGLNDRGYKRWQCGDALAGACKTRIVVNDHCAAGGGGAAPDAAAVGDQFAPPPLDRVYRDSRTKGHDTPKISHAQPRNAKLRQPTPPANASRVAESLGMPG